MRLICNGLPLFAAFFWVTMPYKTCNNTNDLERSAQMRINDITTNINIDSKTDLKSSITSVAWSNDASLIAAVSNFGSHVTLLNEDGSKICDFEMPGRGPVLSNSLAIVDQQKELVTTPTYESADNTALTIWSTENCKKIRDIEGPYPRENRFSNSAMTYSVSEDKNFLAIITEKQSLSSVVLYKTDNWSIVHMFKIENDNAASLAFSKDSKKIVIGTIKGQILVVNIDDNLIEAQFKAFKDPVVLSIDSVDFDPSGDMVIAATGIPNGAYPSAPAIQIFSITDNKRQSFSDSISLPVRNVQWPNNKNYFVYASSNSGLSIGKKIEGDGYDIKRLLGGRVSGFAVNTSGTRVVVGIDRFLSVLTLPGTFK